MIRRAFLRLLGATAALPLVQMRAGATAEESRYQPVGYMDVDRWFSEMRNENGYSVRLDGRDITDGCVWFDDRTGEACCLVRGADGNPYFSAETDDVAKQLLRGRISVVKS